MNAMDIKEEFDNFRKLYVSQSALFNSLKL